jgi:ABC-type lipoprotein release transport system permease subunit
MDLPRPLIFKNLLFAACGDLIRHRGRSFVVTLCLVAILFPLVTALAISEGLRFQAEISIGEGADFYVSEDRYGGNGPISLDYQSKLSGLQGVSRVMSRVVGRTYFVDRLTAVVGLEPEALSALKPLVRGEVPKAPGEVLLGQGIARAFKIQVGMPFSLGANPHKTFKITGILSPACLWSSDLMVMGHRDANEFFRIKGFSTQLLIYTSSDSSPLVGKPLIGRSDPGRPQVPHLRVEDRYHIQERVRAAFAHKGGIFIILYIIVATLAIQAFLITSGFGLRAMEKEIGVMKAIGWRTSEMLGKIGLECLAISLTALSSAILLSMALTRGLNGILIAQFFVAEVGLVPEVDIPSRYLPLHGLLGLALALCITLSGGLLSAWRKAQRSPAELMR